MSIVSVVIPTHNRCDLLKNAVESVQKQTYKNLEIIIINDGSKDNTEEYVLSLKDSRIKYLRNDIPKGSNKSRNFGIKKYNR